MQGRDQACFFGFALFRSGMGQSGFLAMSNSNGPQLEGVAGRLLVA